MFFCAYLGQFYWKLAFDKNGHTLDTSNMPKGETPMESSLGLYLHSSRSPILMRDQDICLKERS